MFLVLADMFPDVLSFLYTALCQANPTNCVLCFLDNEEVIK